jgi:hypothetical protein
MTITNSTHPHTYDILIEKSDKKGYTARVLAWLDCVVEAPTREMALLQIRAMILERLAKAEIVTLEIQPEEVNHPWLKFAGDWADDPTFEEFQAEIERNRREIDAIWSPWLLEPAEDANSTKELELA